jgi:hypothetical protein
MVTHYAILLRGRPFDRCSLLCGLSFSSHRFLFRPVILCFMFYVLCFMFYVLFWIGFLWCLSVLDYGFGMFVSGIASMAAVYRHSSRPASILAALFLPHASSPSSSPPSSSLRRSPFVASCVTSPLSSPVVVVFSVVPLRRLYLGISTLVSAFVLQPLVLRPSFSSFVELSRGLSTVGGGYCHKCRALPYVVYFSSHFCT